MVPLNTLKYLAAQKVKDAGVLLRNGRNNGASYMMGYALEFSLKRKISSNIGFIRGFPETGQELNAYSAEVSHFHALNTGIHLHKIGQLRHHKLDELLHFSGVKARIVAKFYRQWLIVSKWNPESRYVRQRITREKAREFMAAAKKILKEIS